MNKFTLNPRLAELSRKRDEHRAIANQYFEEGSTIQSAYHHAIEAKANAEIRRICMDALETVPSIG